MKGLPASALVRKALAFAAERHAGQRRKGDGKPFIVHPVAVGKILAKEKMPEEVVAAGILHDVLEDTSTTAAELQRLFGRRVARMVQEVTEPDKKYSWEFRKRSYLRHLRHASRGALAISCADKLHNTASLLAAYRREGPVVFDRFSRALDQKLDYHRKVFQTVRRRWPGSPFLDRLERMAGPMEKIVRDQMRDEPKEVEAKFLPLDPRVFGELGLRKTLNGFRLSGTHRERQENRYWDTKDLRLRQAKAVLKTRCVGGKGQMTFKRELSHRGGVSERIEATVAMPVSRLTAAIAGALPLDPVLRARRITGSRPLVEILHLRMRRKSCLFIFGSQQVELDLDEMEVLSGGKTVARHREIEVENRSARGESFQGVLTWLKRSYRGRLRPCRVPKVEIGLRLLRKQGEGR